MKVIIVLYHISKDSLTPPSNDDLKKHGHDLKKLYVSLKTNYDHKTVLSALSSNSYEYRILDILTKFATVARYHNIDALSADTNEQDPLAEWQRLLHDIVKLEIPEKTKKRIASRSLALADMIESFSSVFAHDLENQSMSTHDMVLIPQIQSIAAGYAIWYVLNILCPLCDLLIDLTEDAMELNQKINPDQMTIPYMGEFIDFIHGHGTRAQVVRKKRWP